uniref:Cytochrome P450 n=2 Tax=Scylla olivacea TaxID=85551 RepID=A0A0P4WF68_SCYOL
MWRLQRPLTLCVAGRVNYPCRTATAAGTASSPCTTTPPLQEVPGPRCYPVMGTLFDMIFDKDFNKDKIHIYFKKLFQKYGSVVRVKFPGQPTMVMVHNPEDLLFILNATMHNPVRPPMESLKKARYENDYYEKKSGLVSENGEEWARLATVLRPKVLRPNNVSQYLARMDQVTLDFLQRISTLRDTSGEVNVDFIEELNKWSSECICLISLNQRIGCLDPSLLAGSEPQLIVKATVDFMRALMECESGSKLWKLYPTKIYKQLRTSMEILRKKTSDVLDEIESEMEAKLKKDPSSSLTMLEQLLCQDGITRKDIITFMIDLLPGATETVSNMAAVILYLLAKNPQAQIKVQEEIDQVLGDGVDVLTPKHMNQLSYVKAVVKEANRILPPALGPVRLLQEDLRLGNFLLQKGWLVFLMNAFAGWDPAEFQKHDQFLPERWLRHRPYGDIHPCAVIPFSFGIRMCIGRRIAEQEIYTLIARMLHRYNVEYKDGEIDRIHKFVFSPVGPMKFTFIDRHPK